MTDHEVAGAPSGGTTSEGTRRNGWGGGRRASPFLHEATLVEALLHSWSTMAQAIIVFSTLRFRLLNGPTLQLDLFVSFLQREETHATTLLKAHRNVPPRLYGIPEYRLEHE